MDNVVDEFYTSERRVVRVCARDIGHRRVSKQSHWIAVVVRMVAQNIVMSGVNITSSNPGKEDFLAGVLTACIVTSSLIIIGESFNVVEFGAVGDGQTDDSQVMYLHNCNNFDLSGFTILNSPKEHLSINQCNSGSNSNIHINSPGSSLNTDGIEISASTQINIQDSSIACGDDCNAINGGCSFINISGIACGPGHGIRFANKTVPS
ncbi:hypothetical protein LWI29_014997 [Acer saccharum]|uniref:Uncharacterized protein n=1 Tax=Acer saccharum TaxID=4024 RepID=A0AA39RCM1_ACESA|nr:hypothetical protein LWI29_014997 [Acer saccharum]